MQHCSSALDTLHYGSMVAAVVQTGLWTHLPSKSDASEQLCATHGAVENLIELLQAPHHYQSKTTVRRKALMIPGVRRKRICCYRHIHVLDRSTYGSMLRGVGAAEEADGSAGRNNTIWYLRTMHAIAHEDLFDPGHHINVALETGHCRAFTQCTVHHTCNTYVHTCYYTFGHALDARPV